MTTGSRRIYGYIELLHDAAVYTRLLPPCEHALILHAPGMPLGFRCTSSRDLLDLGLSAVGQHCNSAPPNPFLLHRLQCETTGHSATVPDMK